MTERPPSPHENIPWMQALRPGKPMTSSLSIWAVYDHPNDYPDGFVARRFETDAGGSATSDMFTASSLHELRSLLPPGLVCLSRAERDDPHIVEVWM